MVKTTGLTYEDLIAFPEDNFRRELIDGELIVTAAPATRHQRVVLELGSRLLACSKVHGGEAFVAPLDVFFSDVNVVEPDVLFVTKDRMAIVEDRFVRSAPDIVVEVSSPSTRRLELRRKRDLYERFGVAEYWCVDLDADRVEIYRSTEGRYSVPSILESGDILTTSLLPGFAVAIGELLGSSDESG
jgi:Uma2 family endonuclease